MFSRLRLSDSDLLKSACALFARGIGLAIYPGPAAVLRSDGKIVVANPAATGMSTEFGMGIGRKLHPVLSGAIRAGQYTVAAITLDPAGAGRGGGGTYEFAILPLTAGETALVIGRDTALESAFRGAITESRQRYKELVEICGDFCWETDADSRFSFVSPGGALDYPAEALVGRPAADFLAPLTQGGGDSPFSARTAVDTVDVWFRRADGRLACLETSARPMADGPAGGRGGARGVCRDVTADRNRMEELGRIQIRERLIAHTMRIIRDEVEPGRMLQTAAQATAQAIGARGCRICREDDGGILIAAADSGDGCPAEEVVGGILAQAKIDGRPFSGQHGATISLCVATSYRQAGNGAIVLWRDVADGHWTADECTLVADVAVQLGVAIQHIRNQLALETLSRTDGLSGLLNRRAFTAELEARLARPDFAAGALFYVDLDNFKPVNDIFGHQKGDEALQAVSDMLRRNTRPGDLVARLGGDEFALWLDRTDEEAAKTRATNLLVGARCLAPYSGDPARPLGISLGIAVSCSGSGETFDGLAARADAAMYQVKHNGKAGYFIAAPFPPDFTRPKKAASA